VIKNLKGELKMPKSKISADEFLNNEKNRGFFCDKCGEKLLKGDKFCPNCGKSFEDNKKSNNTNKNLIIVIIALVAILIVIGGILSTNLSNNSFSNVVDVGGIEFNIPEDFTLTDSNYNDVGKEYGVNSPGFKMYSSVYENGSSYIGMIVTPYSTRSLADNRISLIQEGNEVQDTVIGEYSGFKVLGSDKNAFVFKKNEAMIYLIVSPDLENDIVKIIG